MATSTSNVKFNVEENIGDSPSVDYVTDLQGFVRKRKVEEGTLFRLPLLTFVLFFESLPFWLLALDPPMIKSLIFPQFGSFQELKEKLLMTRSGTFYLHVLDEVKGNCSLKFSKENVDQDSLILISGSLTFFAKVVTTISTNSKFIFIRGEHSRLRVLPHFILKLHRVKHVQVGGATKFETVWGSKGLVFTPKYTALRRRIYSYLDFSQRSKPVSLGTDTSLVSHLDLLHPSVLSCNVSMPSDFAASGTGMRKLTVHELGNIFGLPHCYQSLLQRNDFPFIPIQILDGILRPAIFSHFGSSAVVQPPRKRIRVPPPVPANKAVYLPLINRHLSPAWAHVALVEQKAAKDDDAAVDLAKWNDRILLLWPRAGRLISALRRFLMKIIFKRLFREFSGFLRKQHPSEFSSYCDGRRELYSKMLRGARTGGGYFLGSGVKTDKSNIQKSNNFRKSAFLRDLRIGILGLHTYMRSSFLSWDGGSQLLFWRWNKTLQEVARSGFQPCILTSLPRSYKRARKPKSAVFEKILSKVVKAIDRGYMTICPKKDIKNLIDYFGVDKGSSDIRVVFNGTSCGLNDAVWAPNFWLPTAKSMVRILGYNYFPVDLDLGEMFLNFPLSPKLIPYSGIDLSPFKQRIKAHFPRLPLEKGPDLFATWNRDWMGFKPSPEWSCRFYYFAEEFVRGNEKDLDNPLYWKKVVLNLMGNADYNPAMPNVFKWNDLVERIAGDIKAYVDDLRAIGWSLEHAWTIARLIASRLQFLGIQDAARKRRVDGGPWAGTIYQATESKITTTVSKSKWEKGKGFIDDLNVILRKNPDADLNFKSLERIRGFLCHLAMTYDILFPYLKGFHLILCHHLPKRSEEGWKIQELEWIGFMEARKENGKLSQKEYDDEMTRKFGDIKSPTTVKPIPRFLSCLTALTKFFAIEDPPIITQRSTNLQLLAYGFVDASKTGFGASIDYGDHTKYRIGVWGADTDAESSNFREFANLVETIEDEVESKRLNGSYLIMATDNSTVESAIFRGNSSSEKLYDLVVRFRLAELKCGGKFVVTHVSGNRMKVQGTDGISRGELKEGISIGQYMLKFCPWGKSAIDRSQCLKDWLVDNFGKEIEFLTPDQWFNRAHDHDGGHVDERGFWQLKTKPGTYIWTPPPAAADAALEELRKARLKRRASTHIILIPRLMTTLWYKQLNKAADFIVPIPNHFSFWPDSMCEPLVMAFCLPFVRCNPWQLKATPKLCFIRRQLQSVLSENKMDPGDLLLQLYSLGKKLPTMPESMVRKLLFFSQDHPVPYIQNSRSRKRRKFRK